MRLWLVNPFEPLPEAGFHVGRYWALARALVRRGHDVTWWTSDFSHFHKRYWRDETVANEPFRIERIHALSYSRNVSARRLLSHAGLAVALSGAMRRVAHPPDAVLCATPPLEVAAAVAHYCSAFGVPLGVDVVDIWPDSFGMLLPPPLRRAAPLLLAPHRQMLRYALRHAAGIVAISRTYHDWALEQSSGRAAELPTAVIPWAARTPRAAPQRRRPRRPFEATFCGTFGVTYDFDLVSAAAALLEQRAPGRFIFNLIGDGPRRAELLARRHSDNLRIWPAMSADALEPHLRRSSLGLCCYRAQAPQSLPIKLFTYLSYGLPVANTLPGEMSELVEALGVGETTMTAEALADYISRLADDESLWARQAQAGLAYSSQHGLEQRSDELADLLVHLAGARNPRR